VEEKPLDKKIESFLFLLAICNCKPEVVGPLSIHFTTFYGTTYLAPKKKKGKIGLIVSDEEI
jgi:hypothetical protein